MRRAFGYAGAWLVATAVAAAVAWFGCALVLNKAAPQAPELLSPMRQPAAAQLAAPLSGTTVVAGETAPSRATDPRASRSQRPVPTVHLSVATTVRHSQPPARTMAEQRQAPAGQAALQAASQNPAATAGVVTVTGGRATLIFTPDGVQVATMQPAKGYDCYIDQTQPDEVWVVFGRQGHETHVFATWDGGPRANATEYWW